MTMDMEEETTCSLLLDIITINHIIHISNIAILTLLFYLKYTNLLSKRLDLSSVSTVMNDDISNSDLLFRQKLLILEMRKIH